MVSKTDNSNHDGAVVTATQSRRIDENTAGNATSRALITHLASTAIANENELEGGWALGSHGGRYEGWKTEPN